MPVEDERTDEEARKASYKGYALDHFERESLNEIKKAITQGGLDKETIKDYLAFAEELLTKLRHIDYAERKEGEEPYLLESQIQKIEDLRKQLLAIVKPKI